MDNTKVLEVINKVVIHDYLKHLIDAKMRKVVLFESFPYTGAPNLSKGWTFVMVDDPQKLASLYGNFHLN